MSGDTAFHIDGVGSDVSTVHAIGEIVIAILASEQEQETMRSALHALSRTVPAQVAISHCNAIMGKDEHEVDDQ